MSAPPVNSRSRWYDLLAWAVALAIFFLGFAWFLAAVGRALG